MEPHFINEHRSWVGFKDSNGYNVTKGGDGVSGYKRTPELIERHRKLMTGRKQTLEHVEKRMKKLRAGSHVSWSRGKTKDTDPTLAKLGRTVSEKLKGRRKSEETKLKLSKAHNKKSNPVGAKRSEETKQRMRLAQLGKKHSEETKQKMRETRGKKNVTSTI
jgi:hypothetical protein